jgi:hypothetical protein
MKIIGTVAPFPALRFKSRPGPASLGRGAIMRAKIIKKQK